MAGLLNTIIENITKVTIYYSVYKLTYTFCHSGRF
jgi:hypothetical protein